MNYLTNYYRNLSEKLQERVSLLESKIRSLNEDPLVLDPMSPSSSASASNTSTRDQEQGEAVPGLQNFLSAWGTSDKNYDYNGDGVVDGNDLGIFLSRNLNTPVAMGSTRTTTPTEPEGVEGLQTQTGKGGKTQVKAKDQPSVVSRPISDLNYGPGTFSTKNGKTIKADKPEDFPTTQTKKTIVAYPQAGADTKVVSGYDLTPGIPSGKPTAKETGKEIGKPVIKDIGKETGKPMTKDMGKEIGKPVTKETGKGSGEIKTFQPTKVQQKVVAPSNFAPIPGMAMGSPTKTGKTDVGFEMGLPGKMGRAETPTSGDQYQIKSAGGMIGDFNGDGAIDADDLGPFLAAWGTNNSTYDLNGDGIVDGDDYGIFNNAWNTYLQSNQGGGNQGGGNQGGGNQGGGNPPNQPTQRPDFGSIVHSWTSTGAAVDPEYFYSIRRLKKMNKQG